MPQDDRSGRTHRGLRWLCLLVLGWPGASVAQVPMDAWTVEDGLPQNSVYDVLQTRDGYVWVATLGGLARFDGVRFVTFDRATPGIGSLRVRALHEDRNGTLWAGTEDGMLIQYREGQFRTYDRTDGFEGEWVTSIDEGDDGSVLITSLEGLTRFDGHRFQPLAAGDLPRNFRPHPWPSGGQRHWWSQDEAGVHCLARGRVDLCLAAPYLPASPVIGVNVERSGTVWVHTSADGVVRVSEGDVRHYTMADGLPPGSTEGGLFEDPEGGLWISPGGVLPTYRIHSGKREEVLGDTVFRFYQDRDGGTWIGTVSSGLRRIRHHAISMLSGEQGLSSNNVYAMLRDQRGTVWVGTWGAGLNRRLTDGTVVSFGPSEGLPSSNVTAIFEDRAGRLLVGTTAGTGIVAGHRVSRSPDPNGWLGVSVWAMHEDEDGTLWFATSQGLVWQRADRFGRYTMADGLPHDEATALLRSGAGDLWIGTRRGLARLRDGRLTSYTERDGFVGNQVRALVELDDAIWVGTYDGGLYRISGDRLTRYSTANGLHDNGVFQLLDDGRGHFWMGSNRGIARVSRDELRAVAEGRSRTVRPVVFGVQDGMSTLECNGGRHPNGIRSPDGTLWIPTQGGIAIVDPRRVRSAAAPPAHIEAVRVNGRNVDDPSSGIALDAGQDSLEFDYTAPSFVKPDQIRFRYRLVGLHDNWIEAGTRRTTSYHLVPPGRYTFEVTAALGDSEWSTAGDDVAIVIHAPIWGQRWFHALAATCAIVFIGLLIYRQAKQLTRENDRQRAYARQLVEAEERERRRISHDLHDSLGQTLFMIRQQARTLSVMRQSDGGHGATGAAVVDLAIRAYGEMKEIAHALRPYQLDKIGLTRTLESMLERVHRVYGLEILAELENIDDLVVPDAQIGVYRIVQEGVTNIVRHAAATEAGVRMRRRGRGIEIEIWDNGVGFSVRERVAAAETSTGFGLTNLRERAHALNGGLTVQSSPSGGTTLLVRLEPHPANPPRRRRWWQARVLAPK